MYCTYQDGASKHESHIFTCPVHNQNIHFQGQIIFKYAKQLLKNELCFFHKLSYNKKLMVSNHINFKLSREDTQDIKNYFDYNVEGMWDNLYNIRECYLTLAVIAETLSFLPTTLNLC